MLIMSPDLRSLSAGALGAVLALLLVPAAGHAQSLPIQSGATQGISVVGQGVVLAQPNTARITVGVEVFDASLANAQSQASQRMDTVVNKLKSDGIADTDIRTVSFTINPQYDNSAQGQSVLRGYQVQNLVEIRTTNVGTLGPLLDDAVAAGATRIYGIQFEADNMQALKDQARDQAMQNARAKADQLARDSGVSLGRPLAIDESDTGGVTPVRAVAPQAAAPAAVSTPIQPGELQVQTTVRVVWAIQ
jgi:uncharacterized protein YggE